MSTPSVNIPIQLSFDDGVTWKDLVCLTNYSAPLTNPLNETNTFCGKEIGEGVPALDFTGEGVSKIEEPLVNQVSQGELEIAMMAGQRPLARTVLPGTGSIGSLMRRESRVVIESVTPKGAADDVYKFDFSLKGVGIPTITY
jgi:hypothetical protein